MARPILFSQTFPSYHPKAGKPTYFVEKIWKNLAEQPEVNSTHLKDFMSHVPSISEKCEPTALFPKVHTIRSGNRWKEQIFFSPRIWAGPAYSSKQIEFAPDLRVERLWDILILPTLEIFIQGKAFGFFGSPEIETLANNDGLSVEDFQHWFGRLPFHGQIICWKPGIEY